MNGDVGGGCGDAMGAACGEGAIGDAGEADTPAPPPEAPPPVDPGGDVRLNEPPPICETNSLFMRYMYLLPLLPARTN